MPAIHALFSPTGHDGECEFPRGVLKRRCAIGKTPLSAARLCKHVLACHNAAPAGVVCGKPRSFLAYAHPARLILILSLAPTIGLGIGRFAYALVLPDMRDSLHWSYSAAGFMNTINAAGYLVGALFASQLIKRFGLAASVRWGTLAGIIAGAVRQLRQFPRPELCAAAGRPRRRGRIRRWRRAGGDDRAIAARTREFSASACSTPDRGPASWRRG